MGNMEEKENVPQKSPIISNSSNSDSKSLIASREERILEFWKINSIFEKTLTKEAPLGNYVFYDGPPFATGTPHYGHILASAIKDAIPRYQTMRGYRVPRRWGWDCHGLPIENIVEKELGISGKKQIEQIGVEKFNEYARSKVLTYVSEWKKTIDRMGRWVDFDGSYKTMDNTFIESVWWALGQLDQKGLLYEGVRVLPYCPRCETPIANSEIAMDNSYKDITDISVYVKLYLVDTPDTFLVAWTTTPWTLPGNTAAAVNKTVTYVKVKQTLPDGKVEYGIVAQDLYEKLKDKFVSPEIISEIRGSELVGKIYTPPFDYFTKANLQNAHNGWKVYAADYVTTESGTGIVHLAPAYGEEDMALAQKEGVPFVRHVGPDGFFTEEVTDFKGQKAKPKEDHQSGDVLIIKYLAAKGLLFAKEKIIHSYPHCFRCETPLYYFAIPAWFIKISEIKQKLFDKNESMTWIPEHLKEGRFKKSMEGAPDWNISRNRYWASPLPIWKCESCHERTCINSIEQLKERTKRSFNTYTVMRHGESRGNTTELVSSNINVEDPLTEKGQEQAVASAEKLKGTIDLIIASPFMRTKMTAELVHKTLGLPAEALIFDERLHEINAGIFEGKKWADYHDFVYGMDRHKWFSEPIPGGESFEDVRARVGAALYDLESKYKNKRILIVTHGGPGWLLFVAAGQFLPNGRKYHCYEKDTTCAFVPEFKKFSNAEFRSLPFVPLPHNRTFGLDLHRPYIDEVTLMCQCGKEMKRIPEVIDCWFESGSMPFAQDHYPFEREYWRTENFPAGFVAEYIAQTRTWFYYTHVLSTLLFDEAPFKHVVTTGTVLAEDGQKMSKSKNNFPDPWIIFNKYGVDAVRMYLLANPIMRGEDMNFSEKEVGELSRKIISRLDNVVSFYELYRDDSLEDGVVSFESIHVLDRWIVARLNQILEEVTSGMEAYELDRALRPIDGFIDDLSTWYLRRSRDRLKDEGSEDAVYAKRTLYSVLMTLVKILAPFTPFTAEDIYLKLKKPTDPESVHLTSWPDLIEVADSLLDKTLIEDMAYARNVVTLGLEARQEASIKVRQPLSDMRIKHYESRMNEFTPLITDELNIKKLLVDKTLSEEVVLNTLMTPELKEEGIARDFIRLIQEKRKQKGFNPSDTIRVHVEANVEAQKILTTWMADITKTIGAKDLLFEANVGGEEKIDDFLFKIEIDKVSQ